MSAAGRDAVEMLKKYGVNPTKTAKSNGKLAERTANIVKEAVAKDEAKGPSRNDLMLQAKVKGIKNFRILNKAELFKVIDPTTIQQEIDSIVIDAVARWKSGWGSKKKATT